MTAARVAQSFIPGRLRLGVSRDRPLGITLEP